MKKIYLLFFAVILVTSCEKDELNELKNEDTLASIATVSEKEALDFLRVFKSDKTGKSSEITIFYDHLRYEPILNSEEQLMVIPAQTKYDKANSRVLLLKIKGEIRPVLFNMIDNTVAKNKTGFSGKIIISDLDLKFIAAYRVKNGIFISKFLKKENGTNKSSDCDDELWYSDDLYCYYELDAVMLNAEKSEPTPYISISYIYPNDGGGSDAEYYYTSGGGGGSYVAPAPEEEKIINELTGKAKCVYEKLNQNSTDFANAIKKFDGEFPVAHLKLTLTVLPNGTRAITKPPVNYFIEIQLSNNNSESGVDYHHNLMTAKTIIHETIHAEMWRKILSIIDNGGDVGGLTQQQWTNKLSNGDFPGIFYYYSTYGINGFQHPQMATHYRNVIADALQNFDGNQHPRDFYMDLAWEGLRYSNIPAWENLTPEEKERIKIVIDNYISNNTHENCSTT